ncbi:hypothetical protein GCM10010885_19900 [Alicyclobacillus cellulosilyticus]|uniref:Uricase n=1 Tax=Alicyclobacillus cellulosilyticus TaxID=1003997 RepID=A0A917KGP6_9BACL|nr:urate oxidase [Alicyclobacillus cellulosilyticus]GGJ10690.1 hypothetical protein GCM10010885_19900 [Alicyclobacillus cellulosilyticus]
MSAAEDRTLYYGKDDVYIYRTFVPPLYASSQIPESPFVRRSNVVFGVNVRVCVGGEAFLPSFTEGDNSMVVATDSMKNFLQRHMATYQGITIDGFLSFVGERLLTTYPQMSWVELYATQVPFDPVDVPSPNGFTESGLVFRRSRNECATASVKMVRGERGEPVVVDHWSGITDLQLIKVVGNSFVGFVRDEYTTLPEDPNRPLFVFLNMRWRYNNPADALLPDPTAYVPAEQIRDIACTVFHETATVSIQNLIYRIGCAVLRRFPHLAEIRFESQNRTWDTVVESIPESPGKVYTEPRPPYGFQGLSITREDVVSAPSA